MKKTLVFAALIAAVVALSQTFGQEGTTFVMLLLVVALYIFAEMNSVGHSAASEVSTGKGKMLEFENDRRQAA